MSENLVTDAEISNENYEEHQLDHTEFEFCTFINCDFSRCNSRYMIFTDCTFTNCNFSSAKIHNASLRDVTFTDCKILGVDFEHCNQLVFKAHFENCRLDFSSFFGFKMKKTMFVNCSLKEADFTQANLTGSVFDACDLGRAIFHNTVAEKVDFRTSFNFSIDPEINRIRKSKFSVYGLKGLLDKYELSIEPS